MPILISTIALLLLCLSAQITLEVPWGATAIPFSLQSIAVFLIGWYRPPAHAAGIILVYLLLGGLGLPVFADGESGWTVLAGGSGGFLHGFFWSALFLALWHQRGWTSGRQILTALLLATVILFTFGLLHLTVRYDFGRAVQYGLAPFWVVALLKAVLIWGIISLQRRLRRAR